MSEQVARLAVNLLRKSMYSALPQDVQAMFPPYTDPLLPQNKNPVPNIVVGEYRDFGVNVPTPLITVNCDGAQEGLVNVYRHLNLNIDIWIGGNVAPNVDGRRLISIIYEYINRSLQNVNWTGVPNAGGNTIQIERCYETERSRILFEASTKVYHLANIYRVEALCKTWY